MLLLLSWLNNLSSPNKKEKDLIGKDSSVSKLKKGSFLVYSRLLAFRVFITPANGINTELAKNLILAGVNISIYDDALVTEEDF